jgi:PAS domain S-box-containing protein
MAVRIRNHDWRGTSLGPVSDWPQHVRCAVQLILDSPEPMCLLWTSEGFHLYNDAYMRILSIRHPDALGRTFGQVWPESAHLDEFRHGAVFRTGAPALLQDRPYVVRDNGVVRERFFTVSAIPLRNSNGSTDAVIQRLVDTTEHTETQRRLRHVNSKLGEHQAGLTVQLALSDAITDESARLRAEVRTELQDREERLRLALMAGRLATWDWNIETGKVVWSDQMYTMHGYSPDEIEPSFGAWAQRLHPDDLTGLLAQLDLALTRRQEFVHRFRTVHPDGSVHWCSARGRYFYDKAGRALRMLAVAQDVTEEHRAREQQKLLVAELQHRTRNLLGVIRALAALTCDDAGSLEQFRAQFSDRLDALSRAQGLLSRAAGEPITLASLIRLEFEALGTGPIAQQLSLNGPEIRLQSSIVQAFALVIHELTTNALKHGALLKPEGRVSVTWKLLNRSADEVQLRLEWSESGNGAGSSAAEWGQTGYGRELLEHMLPYVLDARTTYEIAAGGAQFTIELPLCINEVTGVAKITAAQ